MPNDDLNFSNVGVAKGASTTARADLPIRPTRYTLGRHVSLKSFSGDIEARYMVDVKVSYANGERKELFYFKPVCAKRRTGVIWERLNVDLQKNKDLLDLLLKGEL